MSLSQDLVADLKSELSGNFSDLVLALMQTLRQLDARELRHAMKVFSQTTSCLGFMLEFSGRLLGRWY